MALPFTKSIRAALAPTAVLVMLSSTNAEAAEYCVDRYQAAITSVNADLGSHLARLSAIDDAITGIITRQLAIAAEIIEVANRSPIDTAKLAELSAEGTGLARQKSELEVEGYALQDQVAALKGNIPAGLQGELRGCIEASKPANTIVNMSIQALAILSTGGASLLLPEKAIYVDMSAVLNGYPFGGDTSVLNVTRDTILEEIGLGDPDNDLNRVLVDPVNTTREFFEDLF